MTDAGPLGRSPKGSGRVSLTDPAPPTRFVVVRDRSAAFIEARSHVGPISFGTTALSGYLDAAVVDGRIAADPTPRAEIRLDLTTLRSGNTLYDAELSQRMSVRRYPRTEIVLRDMVEVGGDGRYRLTGDITLHGVTQSVHGTVSATVDTYGRCVVTGEQLFDIRDFQFPTLSILMLCIYLDVRVDLRLELQATDPTTKEGHD